MLPRSVNIILDDVGEPSTSNTTIKGFNKIIYYATTRSLITANLYRVNYQGLYSVTKAFQNYNNKLVQLRAGKNSKSKLLLANSNHLNL
ncbi:hypothetical protein IEQ34_001220 [Dendrobium chrysotoxum]|uniref:Uncharacterized protein n=1 Tax=Dendrobium chrysotoxum TaxID=161865 RepID=A0AAV7HLA2_DENCH|nr:hypothetical protein IEQ34_001220 [Dendrobium chrysotoxum]